MVGVYMENNGTQHNFYKSFPCTVCESLSGTFQYSKCCKSIINGTFQYSKCCKNIINGTFQYSKCCNIKSEKIHQKQKCNLSYLKSLTNRFFKETRKKKLKNLRFSNRQNNFLHEFPGLLNDSL